MMRWLRRRHRVICTVICLLVFTYVFVINAWMGDDPYITLRSVDNFVNGYGPVWNTDERVQAYTHPLWMLLVSSIYAVTHEGYYSTLVLSFAASGAAIVISFTTIATAWWKQALFTLLLICSKAWVDYSSSGLENPLSFLLLAAFFGPFLRDGWRVTSKRFAYYSFVAALAFLNRADSALLYAPALIALAVGQLRTTRIAKTVGIFTVAMTPAWGWLIFATIYYGFPFPNTAYSKLNAAGSGMPFIHPNGPLYFLNSLRWDPLTLLVIGSALLLAGAISLRRIEKWNVGLLSLGGAVLYLLYTLRIGGDYMSGRFFSMPFFIAVLVSTMFAERALVGVYFAGLALTAVPLGPSSPLLTQRAHEPLPRDPSSILDESGHYREAMGLLAVIRHAPSPGRPNTPVCRRFRETRPTSMVWGAIGYFGFAVGPNVHGIDPIGLPDPLLARLPPRNATDGWGRGHLFHDIPEGYIASIETSQNLVRDPDLHEYYDKLRILTRGPIFTRSRFIEIYRMNTGHYNYLIEAYARRRREAGKP